MRHLRLDDVLDMASQGLGEVFQLKPLLHRLEVDFEWLVATNLLGLCVSLVRVSGRCHRLNMMHWLLLRVLHEGGRRLEVLSYRLLLDRFIAQIINSLQFRQLGPNSLSVEPRFNVVNELCGVV